MLTALVRSKEEQRGAKRSKEERRAVGYDCSSPTSIKVYDINSHCPCSPEIIGDNQKMKILQHVSTEEFQELQLQMPSESTP